MLLPKSDFGKASHRGVWIVIHADTANCSDAVIYKEGRLTVFGRWLDEARRRMAK